MTNTKNKEHAKETPRRTLRLEARVTKEEYDKAVELATTCGLSLSDYIRRVAMGHKPRRRLTEREIEALTSLSDARATSSASSLPSGTYRLTAGLYTSPTPSSWRNG